MHDSHKNNNNNKKKNFDSEPSFPWRHLTRANPARLEYFFAEDIYFSLKYKYQLVGTLIRKIDFFGGFGRKFAKGLVGSLKLG